MTLLKLNPTLSSNPTINGLNQPQTNLSEEQVKTDRFLKVIDKELQQQRNEKNESSRKCKVTNILSIITGTTAIIGLAAAFFGGACAIETGVGVGVAAAVVLPPFVPILITSGVIAVIIGIALASLFGAIAFHYYRKMEMSDEKINILESFRAINNSEIINDTFVKNFISQNQLTLQSNFYSRANIILYPLKKEQQIKRMQNQLNRMRKRIENY